MDLPRGLVQVHGPQRRERDRARAAAEQTALAQSVAGTIANIRPNDVTGDEIHLIEPDGSGDRIIWSTQREGVPLVDDVSRLAWRPDAGVPAWGPQAVPEPVQFNHWLFLPLIRRRG